MTNLQSSYPEIENVVHKELFPANMKAQSRARGISILHAAIECYRVHGIENTTYERIAKKAKVSRPLIFKYFSDYEDIFYKSVKLIRTHFQFYAVTAIKAQRAPQKMLEAYVISTFEWIDLFPSYASGLLLYLQRCSWEERSRDLNTSFVEAGRSRIAALIRFGMSTGEFQTSVPDLVAKQIQTLIAGALITSACESLSDQETYRAGILSLCLRLVEVKTHPK